MDFLKLLLHLLLSPLALCYPTTMKKKCLHHPMEHKSVDYLGTILRKAEVEYLDLRREIRTLEDCVDLCCQQPMCDVALYNDINQGNGLKGSCSLVKCRPLDSCAWRETITVSGAMIFRGTKMPTWPKTRHITRPNVNDIAKKHHRLKRDADNKVKRLGMLGDTVSTALPQTSAQPAADQQTTKQPKKESTNGPIKQPEKPPQPEPQPKQAQPTPAKQKPEQPEKTQDTTSKSNVPNPPAKAEAQKDNSTPQLPKDAQTNQPLVSPAHENPVPKVHTPDNATPSPPNEKLTPQQATQGEQANLTTLEQISTVVEQLKNTNTKSAALLATTAIPGAAKTAEGPVSPKKEAKAPVTKGPVSGPAANGQSPPGPSTGNVSKSAQPESTATPPPPGNINDTKQSAAAASDDGDEPLVVSPATASMNPVTAAGDRGSSKGAADGDAAIKEEILRRSTRSLAPDETTVTNVTAPAKPDEKQTTVPANPSDVDKILSLLDNEDKKGSVVAHVNNLTAPAPNATQTPANVTATPGNVTVQVISNANATQAPAANVTEAMANVTAAPANVTNATIPALNATEKALNRTRPDAPTESPALSSTQNSFTQNSSTQKDFSDHGGSMNAYAVNITTGEKVSTTAQSQQTTPNTATTTAAPDVTSSATTPETAIQNNASSPETTIASDLAKIIEKLLGTSTPGVETKTTKTQVTVTADNKKTTVSITSQNTTPVNSEPGNKTVPQQDSHISHSGVTATGSLVAALSFGCIFLFGVILLIGKRLYDGYQRRHYSKVDYLVNGMYN